MRGLISGLAFLTLFACAPVSHVVIERSRPARPEWLTHKPQNEAYFFFLGVSTGAESLEAGESSAVKDGLGKIAAFLGTTIESQFYLRETELEQKIKEELKTRADAYVAKAFVADSYYEKTARVENAFRLEKFDVYVLIRFPKVEAENEVGRRETETRETVQSAYALYQKGRSYELSRQYALARNMYREAIKMLGRVKTSIPVNDSEAKNSGELLVLLRNREKEAIGHLRRTYIWITERTENSGGEVFLARQVVSILAQSGFTAVSGLRPEIRAALVSSGGGNMSGELLQRLRESDVRLLIVGEATTAFSSYTMGSYFYYATGSLRVVDTETGEIIATVPIKSREAHRDRTRAEIAALEEAGKNAGPILIKELLAREGS